MVKSVESADIEVKGEIKNSKKSFKEAQKLFSKKLSRFKQLIKKNIFELKRA